MKGSLIIVMFFILGLISGLFNFLPESITNSDFSSYALYLLMFLVGIGIGVDKNAWQVIKSAKIKIILVPLTVVFGSLIGGGIISLFLKNINLKEALAISSGFGYYSLSSIFITKMCNETLGVVALLSNIMRELLTLLATPIFLKYFGKLAPIAAGGATSMDTTLPIITKFSGKEFAIIAIFSGTVLTILVPFLVTFILQF